MTRPDPTTIIRDQLMEIMRLNEMIELRDTEIKELKKEVYDVTGNPIYIED